MSPSCSFIDVFFNSSYVKLEIFFESLHPKLIFPETQNILMFYCPLDLFRENHASVYLFYDNEYVDFIDPKVLL